MIDKQVVKRFWSHTKKGRGCWVWFGAKFTRGYGQFKYNGSPRMAHRIAYEIAHGPIGPGLYILHSCDTPLCVRPGHLKPGTPQQNGADAMLKGRAPSGERNGNHKLTEAQVRQIHRARERGVMVKEISRRLDIDPRTVWCIRRGVTWRHVPAV